MADVTAKLQSLANASAYLAPALPVTAGQMAEVAAALDRVRSVLMKIRGVAGERADQIIVDDPMKEPAAGVLFEMPFTAAVVREGEVFVARCREVEVASQGPTEGEALDALREALELCFEGLNAERTARAR